ncbi:MAG: aspartate/glutamate racemase family protein [Bacteroidales bacterium]
MNTDAITLFSRYMELTGVPELTYKKSPDPLLQGKKLGVVNGSSWISLWSNWFGKKILPGVKIINVGNEAVQLNFMRAHSKGLHCPPQINIDLFCRYAEDLYRLFEVDAVLISCSTMNRAYREVQSHMAQFNVPVVQIDEAMMEAAVNTKGRILVVATHGPTVESTRQLLLETASQLGKKVEFEGATVEEAFHLLGEGNIEEHNRVICKTIKSVQKRTKIDVVVLAQLSMSVFIFSYPDPLSAFGIPVLNSGETGFARAGEILKGRS